MKKDVVEEYVGMKIMAFVNLIHDVQQRLR